MTERVPPPSRESHDEQSLQQLIDFVIDLNKNTYKRNTNMEIAGDPDSGGRSPDLVLEKGVRLILSSPNGTKYAIGVQDDGLALTITAV